MHKRYIKHLNVEIYGNFHGSKKSCKRVWTRPCAPLTVLCLGTKETSCCSFHLTIHPFNHFFKFRVTMNLEYILTVHAGQVASPSQNQSSPRCSCTSKIFFHPCLIHDFKHSNVLDFLCRIFNFIGNQLFSPGLLYYRSPYRMLSGYVLKNKEEVGEKRFNHVMSIDSAYFFDTCNFPLAR